MSKPTEDLAVAMVELGGVPQVIAECLHTLLTNANRQRAAEAAMQGLLASGHQVAVNGIALVAAAVALGDLLIAQLEAPAAVKN